MTFGRITCIAFLVSLALFLFAFIANSGSYPSAAAQTQSEQATPHCRLVGGTVMTNFGAIDQNNTLGTATGDLRGAVRGTILGAPQPGAGNTVVFHVRHHWVTESGDTLSFEPATATTVPLFPDTENVSLKITRLELSQRKALGNLKADANAATPMRGEEIGSWFSGQMVRRSHTCCESRFSTACFTSGYENLTDTRWIKLKGCCFCC